jgi:hypothetical protein
MKLKAIAIATQATARSERDNKRGFGGSSDHHHSLAVGWIVSRHFFFVD